MKKQSYQAHTPTGIIIQSKEDDATTYLVEAWLRYFRKDYKLKRLDGNSQISDITLQIDNSNVKTLVSINNEGILECGPDTKFWYRRGYFSPIGKFEDETAWFRSSGLKRFIDEDWRRVIANIYDSLPTFRVNCEKDNELNKVEVLLRAKSIGLNIPATLVTTDLVEVIAFKNKYKKIVTKNMYSHYYQIKLKGQVISTFSYTNVVTKNDLTQFISKHGINKKMHVSCFQKYVEKKFEIRCFIWENDIYSMAIFSQKNRKTRVDLRNHDHLLPNNTTPFLLPKIIELKLKRLMKILNLKSGSIDLIYGKDKKFHFLEVNPIGQFSGLSQNCNYYIEKNIAQWLLKN